MRKRREIKRVRILDNTLYYTKEELNAIDYFDGTGTYGKFQDPTREPNIFDTRKSYLLKMQDDKLRDEFLKRLSHGKNLNDLKI